MKRFFLAAALALLVAFASTDTASAQYVYRYNTVNPYNGSFMSNRGVITPFSSQAASRYYNPWTGMGGQQYMYHNPWGTTVYRSSGVNPYFGHGYTTGYSFPGFGISPYYGTYYRWGW